MKGGKPSKRPFSATDKPEPKPVDEVEVPIEDEERFMAMALDEARIAGGEEEVPVGAVLTMNGEVLARAHNRTRALVDPTAHAEILVLREGARLRGNFRLADATLYSTIEPCPMCAGAIVQARIRRLVYGARDEKGGAVRSLYRLLDDPRLNHRVEIVEGLFQEECSRVMKDFFAERRNSGLQ